jgi:hypothetical protein
MRDGPLLDKKGHFPQREVPSTGIVLMMILLKHILEICVFLFSVHEGGFYPTFFEYIPCI